MSLANDALRARINVLEQSVQSYRDLTVQHWTNLQAAWAENDTLREVAKHLDDMLLRFAFDAGAIGDEVVSGLGVDPWGTLRDFRAAFGLEKTMTPEEWTRRAAQETKP